MMSTDAPRLDASSRTPAAEAPAPAPADDVSTPLPALALLASPGA